MINLKQLRKKNINEIKRMLAMGFAGEDYKMIIQVYNEKKNLENYESIY